MTKEKTTRKAIALRYDKEKENAPKVIAKGNGLIADEILEAATRHDIHVHEDPGLMELLTKLEIHQQIPDELYKAVAEIFAFVYKLDKQITSING